MPILYYLRYHNQFLFIPLAVAFLFVWVPPMQNGTINAVFAGFLLWTITEYWMHRTLFHWRKSPFWDRHMVHHREPLNHDEGGVDNVTAYYGLGAAVALLLTMFGEAYGPPIGAGYIIGYYGYILTHHLIHVGWLHPDSTLRRRHELHHKGWAKNYNLLCPLGDLLWGTYMEPPRLPSIKDHL